MSKVYVGNLPLDIKERELEDLFGKYGKIRFVDVKSQGRPPAFAFIDFSDARDAQDAVRGRDGVEYGGQRLRCEIARGGTGRARDNFVRPQSKGHRVLIKGLPKTCSWQDLKDHVRTVVRPTFTDVRTDADGAAVGIVEFETYDDLKLAIRKLDDTEFSNPRYDRGYIVRYIEDTSGGRGDRDDDRRRSRSRSPRGRRAASRSMSPGEPRRRDAPRDRERDTSTRYDDRDRDRGRGRDAGYEARPKSPISRSRSRSRSHSRSRSRSRSA